MASARSAARDLTGADGVTFVIRESNSCYYADEDAIAPLRKGKRFPLESCISGWVMTHNVPAVIPDVDKDSRVSHDAYRKTFVKSLVMVPVRAREPLAAIGAYWATEHHATDYEVEALVLLADSAGLALTNVQLYQELTGALARERQARIVAETATAAKDEFMALVAHELRQPLHASLAALRLMETRVSREARAQARSVVERQVIYYDSLGRGSARCCTNRPRSHRAQAGTDGPACRPTTGCRCHASTDGGARTPFQGISSTSRGHHAIGCGSPAASHHELAHERGEVYGPRRGDNPGADQARTIAPRSASLIRAVASSQPRCRRFLTCSREAHRTCMALGWGWQWPEN